VRHGSLKERCINDTSARPFAILRGDVSGEREEERRREKRDKRRNKRRSGNTTRPRMKFTARVGSILRGLLSRCWIAESRSRAPRRIYFNVYFGLLLSHDFYGVTSLPIFRKLPSADSICASNFEKDSFLLQACTSNQAFIVIYHMYHTYLLIASALYYYQSLSICWSQIFTGGDEPFNRTSVDVLNRQIFANRLI